MIRYPSALFLLYPNRPLLFCSVVLFCLSCPTDHSCRKGEISYGKEAPAELVEICSKYLFLNSTQSNMKEEKRRITEEYLTQEELAYPVVLTKSNLNGACMVAIYLKCRVIS